MKVLLINPPVRTMIRTILPEGVEKNRGFSPPLGLLYIAAALRARGLADVCVLDAQAENLDPEQMRRRIENLRPDLAGIAAMTFTLPDVLDCASAIKDLFPHVPVVLGGPHAGLYPRITLQNHHKIDFVLQGEAENSFCLLVQALREHGPLNAIPGLAYRCNGEIIENDRGPVLEDLDSLPFPARDLLNADLYTSVLSGASRVTTMITGRGCPYRCTFCYRSSDDMTYRARSASNVVAEMHDCLEMGIEEIFFYDDTFNLNRNRVADICRELIRCGSPVGWDARCRVDLLDAELLNLMKRAGCRRLHLGVETGTPEQMKLCRKGIRLDQAREAFYLARQIGIDTLAYFMLGFPGETEEEMTRTIRFALSLPTRYTQFAVTMPFPGTELYESEKIQNPVGWDPWRRFAEDPHPDFCPPRAHGPVEDQRLRSIIREAYLSYYRRPSYLVQSLAGIRSWQELIQKGRVGMQILFGLRKE